MKFLVVLLALFAVAFAQQQQHLDNTVVTVGEAVDATSEHFLISVDHIEDVVDSNGAVVAERDIRVAVRFDVAKDTFTVNGVPVELGYSELQIMAQVVEVLAEGQQRPFDDLVQLSLRVFVALRQVQLKDGTQVDGVVMQERVVGIQSSEVWQADVIEQSFIFRQDGTVHRQDAVQVAVLQGEPLPNKEKGDDDHDDDDDDKVEHAKKPGHHGHKKPGHHGHKKPHDDDDDHHVDDHHENHEDGKHWVDIEKEKEKVENELKAAWSKAVEFFHTAARWFHSLPFYQRVLVAFAGGVCLALVSIALIKCLRFVCCCRKSSKTCSGCKCSASKTAAPSNYKDNIRVYSLQYTAVPQDEKDAKKKEEGSIEMV